MSNLLQRSNDRKVANCVSPSGKVLIANTFGLPAGANFSCTHATGFCSKICYAGNIERVYPSVRGVLERNWEALIAPICSAVNTAKSSVCNASICVPLRTLN